MAFRREDPKTRAMQCVNSNVAAQVIARPKWVASSPCKLSMSTRRSFIELNCWIRDMKHFNGIDIAWGGCAEYETLYSDSMEMDATPNATSTPNIMEMDATPNAMSTPRKFRRLRRLADVVASKPAKIVFKASSSSFLKSKALMDLKPNTVLGLIKTLKAVGTLKLEMPVEDLKLDMDATSTPPASKKASLQAPKPLTKVDLESLEWTWNERCNICLEWTWRTDAPCQCR